MKWRCPAGTRVEQIFSRVTLHFRSEKEAEAFCDFLKFIDSAKDGQELVIKVPPISKA